MGRARTGRSIIGDRTLYGSVYRHTRKHPRLPPNRRHTPYATSFLSIIGKRVGPVASTRHRGCSKRSTDRHTASLAVACDHLPGQNISGYRRTLVYPYPFGESFDSPFVSPSGRSVRWTASPPPSPSMLFRRLASLPRAFSTS